MLHMFSHSVSLPSQSVQFLFTFFCSKSSIQIVICTSLHYHNCLFRLILFFLYIFLVFSPLILFHAFFTSFMLSSLLHFFISPPCLPISLVCQMSLPAQSLLFFVAFLLLCSTHQVTHPCISKYWSPSL